jgi:hypothetical protein
VQAPVESFVSGSSITLLGITYAVQDARFQGGDDEEVSKEDFFIALKVGMLAKIKDEKTADGAAEEVELESNDDLDGELEFEDDEDDEDDEDEEDEEDEEDDPEV